jgi:type II secretory pathway pseudopilin PulG
MFVGSRIRQGSRSAGFSMLELMIGIGVLLVAVLGALGSQLVSNDLLHNTRETDAATTDLQAAMEQVLLRAPAQIPIAGSPFQSGQPIAAFERLHLKDERIIATYPGYTVGLPVPDPLQIVLNATWTDFRGRPRSMRIACLKTR